MWLMSCTNPRPSVSWDQHWVTLRLLLWTQFILCPWRHRTPLPLWQNRERCIIQEQILHINGSSSPSNTEADLLACSGYPKTDHHLGMGQNYVSKKKLLNAKRCLKKIEPCLFSHHIFIIPWLIGFIPHVFDYILTSSCFLADLPMLSCLNHSKIGPKQMSYIDIHW